MLKLRILGNVYKAVGNELIDYKSLNFKRNWKNLSILRKGMIGIFKDTDCRNYFYVCTEDKEAVADLRSFEYFYFDDKNNNFYLRLKDGEDLNCEIMEDYEYFKEDFYKAYYQEIKDCWFYF